MTYLHSVPRVVNRPMTAGNEYVSNVDAMGAKAGEPFIFDSVSCREVKRVLTNWFPPVIASVYGPELAIAPEDKDLSDWTTGRAKAFTSLSPNEQHDERIKLRESWLKGQGE